MAKLDVKGAFDKVRRSAVADLLQKRTRDGGVDMETRWLLRQLAVDKIKGVVPGGHPVEILCKALNPLSLNPELLKP